MYYPCNPTYLKAYKIPLIFGGVVLSSSFYELRYLYYNIFRTMSTQKSKKNQKYLKNAIILCL